MYGGGVVEMPLQLKLRRLKSLRVPSSFTIICSEAFGDAALLCPVNKQKREHGIVFGRASTKRTYPNENSPVDSGRAGSCDANNIRQQDVANGKHSHCGLNKMTKTCYLPSQTPRCRVVLRRMRMVWRPGSQIKTAGGN